jgi:HK97 family phage major capsid protein
MLARLQGELDSKRLFQDQLIEAAQAANRDLSEQEMELFQRSTARMGEIESMLVPMRESARIAAESAQRSADLARAFEVVNGKAGRLPATVEYRSAGEYVLDRYRSMLGEAEAGERLEIFHRAASHQTTTDNPGLIPTPIIGPVVDFIDSNRSLVTQLGPRNMPSSTWSRPKVTQHTTVALQSAEKAELASQKMVISKITGNAATYGGYVNVSRQNIDFTQPAVMDAVINDLAGIYAIQTEAAAASAFDTAATAGLAIPTGAATLAAVSASLWDGAAKIYSATKGAGRVFAVTGVDMLAILAPVFPPVMPWNNISQGMSAADFGTGLITSLSGIPLYVSSGVGTLRILMFSTAAAEVYEQRVGALSVVEPSVLGVQVAYAGYFTPLVIDSGGIVKITKTP